MTPGMTRGPMRTRSSSSTTIRCVVPCRWACSNTARAGSPQLTTREQVGIRRLERADAEIREHVSDGAGERPAAGVVVQSDPQPRLPNVQGAGIDDGAAGEQRPEHVVDVDSSSGTSDRTSRRSCSTPRTPSRRRQETDKAPAGRQ